MSELNKLQNADENSENSQITEPAVITNNTGIEANAESSNSQEIVDDSLPENDETLQEIDASNAEDAEDEGNKERHSLPLKAYDEMSLDTLVDELEKLIQKEKVQAIKSHVDAIKQEFNSKYNTLVDEKKTEFLSEGGNEIDFYYSIPVQKRFKDAHRDYRSKLNAHYKSIEQNLKQNLQNKLAIIEELKGLIGTEENINTTYKQFKDLQERWRNTGPIPRDKYNNAWNSYHHHVEIFYDFLHLNRDLRDLDFKHNLDKKLKIIARAEALTQEEDAMYAFRELQELHKMWKEELGPVDKEHRESIWERFKAATKLINDKRQLYFKEMDKVHEINLEKKLEIIQSIETIAQEKIKSHSGWQKKIKDIESLRENFFKIGKVPIKVNEDTWAKFKNAVRDFNRQKNAFYKDLKREQYENLQKKRELVQIAEDNKNSEDIEATTPLMKKIQSDWKKIGHVPRKDSDKIWKQFKSACNHYFDRIHSKRDEANKELLENFNKKQDVLEEVKTVVLTKNKTEDLKTIKDYVNTWKNLGRVPSDKRFIDSNFNKAIDALFTQLDMNKSEAEMLKFESKLETLNSNDDNNKSLDNEFSFIKKRIDEIKSQINQLENNLEFFTNVKDDNPLVKEVKNNISKHKEELKLWSSKLARVKALY